MNTTPIEKCFIGAHAQLTVDIATQKGWSNFSIFPNGDLWGTAPNGREGGVPDYAQRLKDAAPALLAALKDAVQDAGFALANDIAPQCVFSAWLPQAKAAIAAAESEVKQCPQQAIADSETCLLSCAT